MKLKSILRERDGSGLKKANRALERLDRVLQSVWDSLDYRLMEEEKEAIIKQHVDAFLRKH